MSTMSRGRSRLLGVFAMVVAGLVACGGANGVAPRSPAAYIRVLNTWPGNGAIDVLVNGQAAVIALSSGSLSPAILVSPGVQTIALRRAGDVLHAPPTRSVTLSNGDTVVVLALDSNSVLDPWVLTDLGAAVAPGRSKLRVVHFAHEAPSVLFYASEPDHPASSAVMFPFPYGSASPYLESTSGNWTINMATEHYAAGGAPMQTDTLLSTGTISIPAGQSRTVVFIDGLMNGYRVTVLTP